MKTTPNAKIYKVSTYIAILFLAIIAIVWLLDFNRYHVLAYHEDVQLFRTDYFYFHKYIINPGGLTAYLGSFLTQFYHYPWIGALIISLSISLIYILFIAVCKKIGEIERFFILPFIIPVLLLISSVDPNIRLANILGVLLALSCFLLYSLLKGKFRYSGGIFIYLILYFVAGGNVLLFVALALVSELFNKDRSYIYLIGIAVCSVLIPYIAYEFIYITTLKSAYLALTPYTILHPNKVYTIAWFSIPVIFLLWQWLSKKTWLEKTNVKKVLIPYFIIASVLSIWSIGQVTDKDSESVAHMAYEVERGNWEEVIKLGADYKSNTNNVLSIYFTNIALSELGQLSSRMFHFKQTGVAGLYLSWSTQYYIPLYNGELYYRLGIIPEAEHSAYEAMVSSPNEHGSKTLRRLVYTTMLRGDSAGFEKYNWLFRTSLVYDKWAQQQREYFRAMQIDAKFKVQGLPTPAQHNDFYINYDNPEYNLILLLRSNPNNKKAFEYMMATFLVQKDMKMFLGGLERFYNNFSYEKLPRHYEEALLICKYSMPDTRDMIGKYPISKQTEDEFMAYNKMSEGATYDQAIKKLQEAFGNTYWYYYQQIKPAELNKTSVSNRY